VVRGEAKGVRFFKSGKKEGSKVTDSVVYQKRGIKKERLKGTIIAAKRA